VKAAGDLAGEGVLDEDRALFGRCAADADVAAAVDEEAGVVAQPVGDGVGQQALGSAARVELDARRAGD
jgi:hypothetical protein